MSQTHTPGGRLLSLDAYRGLTMLLMASSGFGLLVLNDNPGWQWLAWQFDHVPWTGGVIWDMIQPSFIFIVGVAMPLAFAARRARGQEASRMFRHVLRRSLTLLLVGMAIVCVHKDQVLISLTTVLQQIAIAYFFAFFVLGRGVKIQVLAAFGVLAAHWACFQFWPGVGPEGPWAKNANFASALDFGWLGRSEEGGYTSFNAFSSIATVIFGILAGELLLKDLAEKTKLKYLVLTGAALLALGLALHPFIPIVKRIWTPSWAIYSAGWAYLLLALFYWLIEMRNKRKWCFIFTVVGLNSISIYVFYQMLHDSIDTWLRVFTRGFLTPLGDPGVIIQAVLVLALQWYFVYWLYKNEIFLKVG